MNSFSFPVPPPLAALAAVGIFSIWPIQGKAIGFDADDYIITELSFAGPAVLVYDHDFKFKGYLGPEGNSTGLATGLDFDAAGLVVARGSFDGLTSQIRVFEPDGSLATNRPQDVTSPPGVLNLAVADNGNYFVAGQNEVFGTPNGLLEIAFDGEVLRQIDADDYEGVAVLPGGVVVGGGGSDTGFLRAFDAETDQPVFSFSEQVTPATTGATLFDQGQRSATDIDYSPRTDSLLLADRRGAAIFERETDGTFIRRFDPPGDIPFNANSELIGVTRGPGGDVYAIFRDVVVRWDANGNYVESIDLSDTIGFSATGILWASNAPGLTFVEGDYNGDGFVSQADLDLVLLNWGDDVVPTGWVSPDIFDGGMSQNELDAVLLNWGDGSPPTPSLVPEPATGIGLSVILLALGLRDPRPRLSGWHHEQANG